MPDRFTPEVRSKIMARIRSKNTGPERLVYNYLRANKVYFQKHYVNAPGRPDIALPRKKKAVFIDGEFWHGYTLERRKNDLPIYWAQRIIVNVKRDKRNRAELRRRGWQVMRVWEHELSKSQRDQTLNRIRLFLLSDSNG